MCLDICNRLNIFAQMQTFYVHCNQAFILSSISLLMVQILTILAIQGGSPSPFDRSLATKVPINAMMDLFKEFLVADVGQP